jgi:hypothetical protein
VVLHSFIRRGLARAFVVEIARAIAVDRLPVKAARTNRQHLRNGVGALLDASSQVAFRPDLVTAVFYATRKHLRAEVRYAAAEFRRAGVVPARGRDRLLLVAAPAAAAGVILAVRSRRKPKPPALDSAEPVEASVSAAAHAP